MTAIATATIEPLRSTVRKVPVPGITEGSSRSRTRAPVESTRSANDYGDRVEDRRGVARRRPSDGRRATWSWLPWLWSAALAGALLGPALGRGFVLSYDMVWVPDLTLRPDLLGVGTALPRAVPSDALVAVLDQAVPGMLLQKLLLLGTLVVAGGGAWALARDLGRDPTPAVGLLGGLAAATVYVWNPFVVERLVIGHWPLLVGYAVQPWVALLARRWRHEGRLPLALLVLLPLGSLSAGAGVATALVALAFGVTRRRGSLGLLAAVLAANAPWMMSGLLHLEAARSDAAAAALFAGHGEGLLPAPLAFAGLGGIWNTEVVPVTRTGPLAVAGLAGLFTLVVLGARRWWRSTDRWDRGALLGLGVVGYAVALLGWSAPDLVGRLAAEVPGGGLLRDSTRLLGVCAPLLAVLVAHGATLVRDRLAGIPGLVVALSLLLVPVATMPDAAWGVSGRLDAVAYPAEYDAMREAVGRGSGDVVLLPFTSYRAPAWNDGRKLLDPVGRAQRRDYVANDALVVSGEVIPGEDPLARDVAEALALPTPILRRERLRELGVELAVTDSSAAGPVVEISGQVLASPGMLRVLSLGEPAPRAVPQGWRVSMGGAWLAWLALPLLAVLGRGRRRRRRRTQGSGVI